MFRRQRQRAAITGSKQFFLVSLAAAPHRPDGMDHMPGFQLVAAGDFRLAGLGAAEASAFGQQFRSGRAMNGAVDATAAQEAAVGGIDDGIHIQGGDVGNNDFQPRGAGFHGQQGFIGGHIPDRTRMQHPSCYAIR